MSDIIFLQKREEPAVELPAWVNTSENLDGYHVNNYFLDNPDMVLGVPASESTRYGHDYTVAPIIGVNLAQQLREAITHVHGQYKASELTEMDEDETIPADPDVKNFSYAVVDGKVYYRENSVMVRSKLNATAADGIISAVSA